MDLDALGPGNESEYIVAEHRIAAFCHTIVDALDVLGVDHKYVVIVSAPFLQPAARLLVLLGRT